MKQVEYRFVFNRKGKLNKDGKGLIQIEAYLNGKRKFFSTGLHVLPKQWDKRKGAIKNHPEATVLNLRLIEQLRQLKEFEFEMTRQNGYFDLSMFELLKSSRKYDFWEMFNRLVETENVSVESAGNILQGVLSLNANCLSFSSQLLKIAELIIFCLFLLCKFDL